ncbi:hypothetical protein LRC231 [Methanocella arvoryzae MRE50]|uniref:Uncharacterized protein n=1 Tax=Methanocella arvoryzae (strain DSM 22066 / NBRC 105507 / MRE50) TaxID=351160 RepID=Q0W8S1_METAR|nr:hypothetical protein LRC231 [Methanocella arvoryzae MRE50]
MAARVFLIELRAFGRGYRCRKKKEGLCLNFYLINSLSNKVCISRDFLQYFSLAAPVRVKAFLPLDGQPVLYDFSHELVPEFPEVVDAVEHEVFEVLLLLDEIDLFRPLFYGFEEQGDECVVLVVAAEGDLFYLSDAADLLLEVQLLFSLELGGDAGNDIHHQRLSDLLELVGKQLVHQCGLGKSVHVFLNELLHDILGDVIIDEVSLLLFSIFFALFSCPGHVKASRMYLSIGKCPVVMQA